MAVSVLLLPSLLLDHRLWSRLLPLLSPECTPQFVDRPDLRHITDPAKAIAACEAEAQCRLDQAASSAAVVLVGVSFGGYLAARLARHADGVVAVSSVVSMPAELAAAHRETANAIEQGQLTRAAFNASCLAQVMAECEQDTELAGALRERLDSLELPELLLNLRMTAALADISLAVQPFDTPLMVVHARLDPITPLSCGKELATRSKRSSLLLLDSSSHLLPLTHPEQLAEVIDNLVETLGPDAA